MARSKARILKWVVVVALLGGGITWFALRQSANDTPIVWKTSKLDRGAVEQVVTATGNLNAVVTVQVGSQVSGIILKLGADFNSEVKEGQIIAQIDPTRFRANLQQAHAQLKNAQASASRARVNHEQAQREFDRAKALGDKQVIGAAELDDMRSKFDLSKVELASTQAQVAQARAQVGMAQVDVQRTTIRAPISGVVLQRAVDVGQTVAASLSAPTLFTIAQDLARMEVRAAIDEADVGKLRQGLDARFSVDAYPGQEFKATIFQIRSQPNVQQNVVTYDAILRVDNPDGKLRPGMTANVRIVCERRDNVVRVPNAALRFKPPADLVLTTPASGNQAPAGGGVGPSPAQAAEAPAPGGAAPAAGGPGAGGRRRGGPGGGGPGGGMGRPGGGDRMLARVYKRSGEKVVAVQFRPGIADDEFTEVRGERLKEGDEIVLDASGGSIQQSAPAGRPQGGATRGRGPRMF